MGQSPSSTGPKLLKLSTKPKPPPEIADDVTEVTLSPIDHTLSIPDECLAAIFSSLSAADRKNASLVCRRWLAVEGQNRQRLSLNAKSHLAEVIPRLLMRFDAVTKLGLKCDRRSVSINDKDLVLISLKCKNLTRLKLRACREIGDEGLRDFSENCRGLKKFSCGNSGFGFRGLTALVDNCVFLEELSVKRLRGNSDAPGLETIELGKASSNSNLRVICLKDLYDGQCFMPLVLKAKSLKSLKVFRCSGDWDKFFEFVIDSIKGLVELHLERLQVSDAGLRSISDCASLEVLHLVKVPECTNAGLVSIAEKCRLLRKIHIDGWKTNRMGDEGLIAIANCCAGLQELVLIGLNPTNLSLEKLAVNCRGLERLALCGSETVGDDEISCIAEKCVALKKLCIKSCPVSDSGIEALASGCPNLVKLKVKKCRNITFQGAERLRLNRISVTVNLDVEPEFQEASVSEQDVGSVDIPVIGGRRNGDNGNVIEPGRNLRSMSLKMRLGSLSRRSFAPFNFKRWSSFGGRSRNNSGTR